jgi:hypothetical protein
MNIREILDGYHQIVDWVGAALDLLEERSCSVGEIDYSETNRDEIYIGYDINYTLGGNEWSSAIIPISAFEAAVAHAGGDRALFAAELAAYIREQREARKAAQRRKREAERREAAKLEALRRERRDHEEYERLKAKFEGEPTP